MPNVKPISFNIRHITIPLLIIVTIITPIILIEPKTQFLQDELTTADKNYLIQNYLSTKYTYWNKHTRGEHVKIGIFDSGINNTYTNCNIKQQLDFSSSTTPSTPSYDYLGHGTYISSLICSSIYGISPLSDIFVYKIFDKNGSTSTTSIYNAIKHAITVDNIDIINLSFGGINYNDTAIADLLLSIANKGKLIITSAGNEGPSYGSITFPGNLPYVITVGSVSKDIFVPYKHSSRGPAMWHNELISKPNTWCLGEDIIGIIDNEGKLGIKNGSSISTAIVTAFIALGMSLVKQYQDDLQMQMQFNIANVMYMIYKSNIEVVELNKYERISGLFNPQGMLGLIEHYIANARNGVYDLSIKAFEFKYLNYNETFCTLYSTIQPVIVPILVSSNVNDSDNTPMYAIKEVGVLNEKNSDDKVKKENIIKHCIQFEMLYSSNNNDNGNETYIVSKYIHNIFLKISSTVSNNNQQHSKCDYYKDHFFIKITFHNINSPSSLTFDFTLSFDYIPKPNKLNRIIIDRTHHLIYPHNGSIPKDNLLSNSFDYDWTYESIETNFFSLYSHLSNEGYYIEENRLYPLTHLDLNEYALLLLIDIENELTSDDIHHLHHNFENNNLNIFIISEWHNHHISSTLNTNIHNNTTHHGSSIASLNSFLMKYSIALGNNCLSGDMYLINKQIKIVSGNAVSLFPQGGFIFGNKFLNEEYYIKTNSEQYLNRVILGLYENKEQENMGRIALFTDSFCVDDSVMGNEINEVNCFWLIGNVVRFLIHGMYAYNELDLVHAKVLKEAYYNGEDVEFGKEGDVVSENEIVDMLRKNGVGGFTKEIMNKGKVGVIEGVRDVVEKDVVGVLKGVLAVFVPILVMLIVMLWVIRCKGKEYKQRRFKEYDIVEII